MAATLDASGRYFLSDDGQVIGVKHTDECLSEVAALAFGTVMVSTVGDGALVAALDEMADSGTGEVVQYVFSKEESADIAALFEVNYPVTPAPEIVGPVVALENQIHPPDPFAPHYDWTVAIFDLCANDVSQDSGFVSKLATLWPELGGRIIVLSERADLTISGWSGLPPRRFGDTYVYAFDRFDPDNGIGVANPHGSVYNPGFGWVE